MEDLIKEVLEAELRAVKSKFKEIVSDLHKKVSKRFYFWREDDDQIFDEAKEDIDNHIREKIREL